MHWMPSSLEQGSERLYVCKYVFVLSKIIWNVLHTFVISAMGCPWITRPQIMEPSNVKHKDRLLVLYFYHFLHEVNFAGYGTLIDDKFR